MKTQQSPRLFKNIFLIAILMFAAFSSNATHFRYGNLTWERVPGSTNKIKIKMNVVFQHSFFSANAAYPFSVGTRFNSNLFNPGFGSNSVAVITVTSMDLANDRFQGEWSTIVTYPAPGTYTASTPNFCCRIINPALENNPGNSAVTQHILSTRVQVGPGFNNNNDAPVSNIPPVINFPEHTSVVTYQFPAVDPNGDALSFSLTPNGTFGNVSIQPSGLTISSTGLITWSTTTLDSGKFFYASVRITDAKGAYSTTDFLIKIVGQSTPAIFDSSSVPNGTNIEIQPGDSIVLKFKSSDPDTGDCNKLSASGVPLGSSFTTNTNCGNPVEGTFKWTPADSQQGVYVVSVTSEDKKGVQSSTSFSLDVSYKPRWVLPNTPGNNSVLITEPGIALTHEMKAMHPTTTDGVVISSTGLTTNMGFSTTMPTSAGNPITTGFSWTPVASEWGIHPVYYQAKDTFYNEKIYDTIFYIANNAPVITSTPGIYAYVGDPYTYQLNATDVNLPYGDSIFVEGISHPGFLSLTPGVNDTTWTLSGTPGAPGYHLITIEVADLTNHFGGTHLGNDMQVYTLWVLAKPSITGPVTHVTINGLSNGAIDATVSGGLAPYTYSWSNSATTEDISGVPAGSYTLTVTDANGKTASKTFVVNQPDPLTVSGTVTHVTIFGLSNGAVDATPAGGVAPYTYSWTNSATTEDISGVPAGTYTITVTDANGATASAPFVVNQPLPLVITGITTNVTTFSGSNGTITTTTTGGVGPYTYSWSGSSVTTANRTGLVAGTYTVTVTDANGATATATFTITQPAAPQFPMQSTCIFPYIITLESVTKVGNNYEWVWSIRNPNPGNGNNNGTVQDLSHWDITLGTCASFGSIVSGATSSNGTSWTPFTPTYQADPSISNTSVLSTGNVIKFNVGTSGTAKKYCKLVTTQNLAVNTNAVAYYKSGNKTGSGTLCFPGFGCPPAGSKETSFAVEQAELTVYPNPNNGEFTINIRNMNGNGQLIIRDITGKVINTLAVNAAEAQSIQANLSTQAKGIYLVEVVGSGFRQVTRVSVQ